MSSLSTKIKLYCSANGKNNVDFRTDVHLQDDMVDGVSNPYIKEWNISDLAQPTTEQLNSYETAGNTQEAEQQVLSKRKSEYKSVGDQLGQLYDDMLAGKLDSTGQWFLDCKAVKDSNPK